MSFRKHNKMVSQRVLIVAVTLVLATSTVLSQSATMEQRRLSHPRFLRQLQRFNRRPHLNYVRPPIYGRFRNLQRRMPFERRINPFQDMDNRDILLRLLLFGRPWLNWALMGGNNMFSAVDVDTPDVPDRPARQGAGRGRLI